MRIFLAGATGAIGVRLAPLILRAGHELMGMTRSVAKAEALCAAGSRSAAVDVFDADALEKAACVFRPEIVIHQLTDLPRNLEPSQMAEAVRRNARIRDEGTRNLVAAARAAGATRLIAQSIAWAYAPGDEPHDETSPLDVEAEGSRAISISGVIAPEQQVLGAEIPQRVILRYGQLYGPSTGRDWPEGSSPLHVDAAACAALLAIDRGPPGIYNIVEDNPHVTAAKAIHMLGWRADFRRRQ